MLAMTYYLTKLRERYREEFKTERIGLIKSRVRLLCVLSVVIIILGSMLGNAIQRQPYDYSKLPLTVFLFFCSGSIFYVSYRIKSMKMARIIAYVFTFLLLVICTRAANRTVFGSLR